MHTPQTTRRLLAVALVAAVGLLGACGDDDDAGGNSGPPPKAPKGSTVVEVTDLEYKPEDVRIKVGQTVVWRFDDDGVAHDVAFDDFESDILKSGTYQHRFDEAGEFDYECTIHPSMTGTVEVVE